MAELIFRMAINLIAGINTVCNYLEHFKQLEIALFILHFSKRRNLNCLTGRVETVVEKKEKGHGLERFFFFYYEKEVITGLHQKAILFLLI